jgi:hypothetical protein
MSKQWSSPRSNGSYSLTTAGLGPHPEDGALLGRSTMLHQAESAFYGRIT